MAIQCCYHHEHSHGHSHSHDAYKETRALLDYMIKHNTAHAAELADLGERLGALGYSKEKDQILAAVDEFSSGNQRLAAVLAALNRTE